MKNKKEEIKVLSRVKVKEELMNKIEKVLSTELMNVKGDDVDDYISKECGYKGIGINLKMAKEIYDNIGLGIVRDCDSRIVSVEFKKGGIWWSVKKKDVEVWSPGAF